MTTYVHRRSRGARAVLAGLFVLVALLAACGQQQGAGGATPTASQAPSTPCLPGAPADECVGLSDGSYNLAGDNQFDAVFAAIRKENDRVAATGGPTVSVVYAVPLPRTHNDLSRELKEELEGASLVQRRANDPTSDMAGQPYIQILVANVGDRTDGWQPVTAQIERMLDPGQPGHVVGVAGLGQSLLSVKQAMAELQKAGVPMVPTRLTADGISPEPGQDGVFRIAPSNSEEVRAAAGFLTSSCRPGLVQDSSTDDLYVNDLTANFPQLTAAAQARSSDCVATQSDLLPLARYRSQLPNVDATFQQQIPYICGRNPDTIYFGGRGANLGSFVAALGSRDLRTCPGPITIVTADDGLDLAAEVARENLPGVAQTLPNALRSGIRLIVTGLASPGEWGPEPDPANPTLLSLIGNCERCLGTAFPGESLADGNIIMGHDAMLTLVRAIRAGVDQQNLVASKGSVLQALFGFGGARPVAGASGAIGFDGQGHPIGKTIPILTINDKGVIGYVSSA